MRARLLLALLVAAGCGPSADPGAVYVTVDSIAMLAGVDHLDITVTNGGMTSDKTRAPLRGAPVTIPPARTLLLRLPVDRKGAVTIDIDAADAGGARLATGRGDGTVESGRVTVLLQATNPPFDGGLPDVAVPDDQGVPDLGGVDLGPLDQAVPDLRATDLPPPVDAVCAPSAADLTLVPDAGATTVALTEQVFPAAGVTYAVAVADLDKDGKLDLVAVLNALDQIEVQRGNGAGGFNGATTYAVGDDPAGLSIADLDGDGNLDIVVANHTHSSGPASLSLLLGNGDTSFNNAITIPIPTTAMSDMLFTTGASDVKVADMNRDGIPDLVVVLSQEGSIAVLLGTGGGNFTHKGSYSTNGGTPFALLVTDLDGDCLPDVVVTRTSASTIGVLTGQAAGSLAPQKTFAVGGEPDSIAAGDFDRDGKIDLAVASANDPKLSILLGTGNKATLFNAGTDLTIASSRQRGIVATDWDGDGRLDLVFVQGFNVDVWGGDGAGHFAQKGTHPSDTGGPSVVGDVDGNGRPDYVVPRLNANEAVVYFNASM